MWIWLHYSHEEFKLKIKLSNPNIFPCRLQKVFTTSCFFRTCLKFLMEHILLFLSHIFILFLTLIWVGFLRVHFEVDGGSVVGWCVCVCVCVRVCVSACRRGEGRGVGVGYNNPRLKLVRIMPGTCNLVRNYLHICSFGIYTF